MQVRVVEVSRQTTGFASPGGRDFFLVPSGEPGPGSFVADAGTNPDAETNRRKEDVLATDGGSKGS